MDALHEISAEIMTLSVPAVSSKDTSFSVLDSEQFETDLDY
jgi:hypothetical protein